LEIEVAGVVKQSPSRFQDQSVNELNYQTKIREEVTENAEAIEDLQA
jgi:hypothetical protein